MLTGVVGRVNLLKDHVGNYRDDVECCEEYPDGSRALKNCDGAEFLEDFGKRFKSFKEGVLMQSLLTKRNE